MRALPAVGLRRARRVVAFVGRAALAAVLACAGWRAFRIASGTPLAALEDVAWTRGARVLARDGRLLGERPSAEGLRGQPTRLEALGGRLVDATLASEDIRFRSHDGVDRRALVRALFANLRARKVVSGASTITAQLVKRLDYQGRARPRTLWAKLVETARAQNLDDALDKDALLQAYFDRLDYGRGLAGPEAAARGYFGVPARDLSLAQATLLAVLPRAPSALDPYRHRDRAVTRQRALIARMQALDLVSADDAVRALGEPLVFRDPTRPRAFAAPHVVLAAARVAREKRSSEVRTTIDLDLQSDVAGLVTTHVRRLRERGVSTAAVVVVDALSSEVIAEVGSASWGDTSIDGQVDLVRARRQPGSTLKPFIYARAFERGVSPMAMLADVPTELGKTGASYAPENFDGTFSGPVSAREALAGSLNVPAAKLARDLGATQVVDLLRASGLSLREGAKTYGLSVALGSGEATPLELAAAYTTLARGGSFAPLRFRADDAVSAPTRVFDAGAVAEVADALSDSLARVRGLRTRGPFESRFPVAIKTGTSTGYRDAWTAGFTRERVVVVWVGNADGAPTRGVTGAVGAGPLFHDVMERAMRDVSNRAPLVDVAEMEEASVCPLSGLRRGPACTDHVARRFAKGHAPRDTCRAHAFASPRVAKEGEAPFACDPHGQARVVLLGDEYAGWLTTKPIGAPGADARGVPWLLASRTPACDGAARGARPSILVVSPREGAVVHADDDAASAPDAIDVAVETQGLSSTERLEVLLDGRLAVSLSSPYRARLPVTRGDHVLEVRPARTLAVADLGLARFAVR